jgi:uncharacterized protein YxjI
MHAVLQGNHFLIKEQVGLFRAANHYDVFDAESGNRVLECREERLGPWVKLLRYAFFRRTPFDIQVRTPEGQPLVRVDRKASLLAPKATVRDPSDHVLGTIAQRFFALVEKFDVTNGDGRPKYFIQRNLKGREFSILKDGVEWAHISKRWAGFGRELFTTADTYELNISPDVPPEHSFRALAMAAVLTIDMVLFE